MRHAAALVLLLLAPAFPFAIQSPQPPIFRSGVDLVDVAVVVTDTQGRFVPGLTAADFEITERGVSQTISVFDRVSIPVWHPQPGDTQVAVSPDTASNDRPMDGRLYVLVLDALHVAPANVLAVRTQAKQFVLEHVGPSDLVAVLSPGALPEASQDFTSDKAKLVAAIDHFVGGKLRSATLELEDEHKLAIFADARILDSPIEAMAHKGKDPGDFERADRALSLSSVLQGLSDHLSRVERRRKAVLLFSEGVDYNVADTMGGVQRFSSEVQRAMHTALGALMRSNVSLYAVDPRGLNMADAGGESLPYRRAPNASRYDGTAPKIDLSEGSLEQEYIDSIRSLRYVAEPTGGFALVSSNDANAAFERIVKESSDYYVLGYAPSTRGKPGEFQPIRVRVKRPGTTVIARNGYLVPPARRAAERAATAPSAEQPQDRGFSSPWASRRSGSTERPSIDTASVPPAPKGLHEELAWLLSSALPVAGLPMRVQAAAFKGDDRKQVVQVITEVRGSALAFAERRGRYESRIELASFTVDSRARGANGRATTIDLRLTKDECDRVRATGVRWMSQLELAPGRYQLRVAGRIPSSGAVGLVTADVEVPAFSGGPALSGVTFASANAAMLMTRGETRLASTLNTPPTVERAFIAGDRVVAAAEVYLPAGEASAELAAHVERTDGSLVLELEEKVPGPGPRTEAVAMPIDTSSLAPGRYLLRMRVETGRPDGHAERVVPFEVVTRERE